MEVLIICFVLLAVLALSGTLSDRFEVRVSPRPEPGGLFNGPVPFVGRRRQRAELSWWQRPVWVTVLSSTGPLSGVLCHLELVSSLLQAAGLACSC